MNGGISQPFMRSIARRPFVEQKVLAILRHVPGPKDAQPARTPSPRLSPHDRQLFDGLREAVRARGLHIRSAAAPFVHDDELRLLAWLAQAQRLSNDLDAFRAEPQFLSLLIDCGQALDRLGLRLPPRSLVNI